MKKNLGLRIADCGFGKSQATIDTVELAVRIAEARRRRHSVCSWVRLMLDALLILLAGAVLVTCVVRGAETSRIQIEALEGR